jgi:hypothetical protein
MKVPFPSVIDSTIVAAFRSCPQKAFLEFFRHYKPGGRNVHLHAGAAYAHGLEKARLAYYVEGASPTDAVAIGMGALLAAYGDYECPPDSAKSANRMAGALEFYFDRYPLETDKAVPITLPGGKRGIEVGFAEPIDIKHPETGDPLIYCGRLDQAVDFEGMVLGEDDKTTSSLGAQWSKQWDLRSQFTSYVWGCGRIGVKLNGFLIRGVSILKTKYDTQQAITYRPEWQIDRWYAQLLRDVQRMIACWEEGYFDYDLDHACNEYSGCIFRNVCLSKDSSQILQLQYERRAWDPLNRVEIQLGVEE